MGINGRDEIDLKTVEFDELVNMYVVADVFGNYRHAVQIVKEIVSRAERSPAVVSDAPNWIKKGLPKDKLKRSRNGNKRT